MLDAQNAAATPAIIRREDYSPPDWLVPDIALEFDLDPAKTRVRATLNVVRNGVHDRPLRLDGDGLTPLSVHVDGKECSAWSLEEGTFVIALTGNQAVVET